MPNYFVVARSPDIFSRFVGQSHSWWLHNFDVILDIMFAIDRLEVV